LQRIGVDASARPHSKHAHRAEIVPLQGTQPSTLSVVLASPATEGLDATLDAILAAVDEPVEIVVHSEHQSHLATSRGLRARRRQDGARDPEADLLLCVEPGLVPVTTGWLEEMAFHASLPGTATASAVVLDSQGRVEQAGAIVGASGWQPALSGWDAASDGYAGSLSCAREVSAVYGSWVAISSHVLQRLGGFVEDLADERLQWLELSLRASAAGDRNIVTPRALVRRVSGALALDGSLDAALVRDRWAPLLGRDRFHNPNFKDAAGGYVA
jgi:hypothetical protein